MDYKKLYSEFRTNGILRIEGFLTPEEVQELQSGMRDVVKNIPDESSQAFSIYGPGKKKEVDEFLMHSGDEVRYFFENSAFDSEGKLLLDKEEALNKVGHALHWWHPIFKKHTFSQKIKNLLRNFEYKEPVVVQSKLLFKKPRFGNVAKPHQDSTFLYTDPPTAIGLWFPLLNDVPVESGCLWYVPGSHKGGVVHERHIRNPAKDPLLVTEGKLPEYRDDEYVPIPAKLGDCIVLHALNVHKPGKNTNNQPRTIYAVHMVEKDAAWSEKNWIQPTKKLPFPSLYDN